MIQVTLVNRKQLAYALPRRHDLPAGQRWAKAGEHCPNCGRVFGPGLAGGLREPVLADGRCLNSAACESAGGRG